MPPIDTTSVGRNDPCPCGSGRKYKKCCMGKEQAGPAKPAGPDLDALMRKGTALLQGGRIQQSRQIFNEVLRHDPKRPHALFCLAKVTSYIGELDQSLELHERAIAEDAKQVQFHVSYADTLLKAGRPEESLAAAERATKVDPKSPTAFRSLADILQITHRLDDAIRAARRSVELAPTYTNAAIVLASLEAHKGDRASARDRLQAVLEHEKELEYRHRAWRELGAVLDKMGDYDEAFAAYSAAAVDESNTPIGRMVERGLWTKRVDAYRSHLTDDLLRRWSPADLEDGNPRPAFLVGFPRSGTTMTEHVLAAHPKIVTTDEAPLINDLKKELGRLASGPEDVPTMLTRIDRDQALALRSFYWRSARRLIGHDLSDSIFVDKNPLNIIEAGLINVLFPEARMIVVLRDPRDCCLSCFFQRFRLNTAMVNFLSWHGTAEFYAGVMGWWIDLRDRLTIPWIEIRYEDTVTDLESQARRMLELIDVDWTDEVLRFHEAAREKFISTPSFSTVTQPVNTKAVARWRKYTEPVARVRETLGPLIDAFGYA